jgi:hypothetical protein
MLLRVCYLNIIPIALNHAKENLQLEVIGQKLEVDKLENS